MLETDYRPTQRNKLFSLSYTKRQLKLTSSNRIYILQKQNWYIYFSKNKNKNNNCSPLSTNYKVLHPQQRSPITQPSSKITMNKL